LVTFSLTSLCGLWPCDLYGHYLSPWGHMLQTVFACFMVPCHLRSVYRSLPRSIVQSLLSSLILSWLAICHTFYSSFSWSWFGCMACFLVVKVWLHHFAPPATALAERSGVYPVKLPILVYKCMHMTAPLYLSDELQCMADSETRRCLHSAFSLLLIVHHTWLSTVGDRTFPVLLPVLGTVCPNMSHLQSVCFLQIPQDFPLQAFLAIILHHNFCSARMLCTVTVVIFTHLNCSFLLSFTYLT